MAKLEAMVDKALAERASGERLTLSTIEDIVMAAREDISEQLTEVLVEAGSGQQVPGACCPACGQEMQYKGQKQRYVRTRTGDIVVERAYYYCAGCHQGLFPPG